MCLFKKCEIAGSQIWLAPEKMQKKNKYDGFENDVSFLGCVVSFMIYAGNNLFDSDKEKLSGIYNSQTQIILERLHEAYCFVKNLVAKPYSHR